MRRSIFCLLFLVSTSATSIASTTQEATSPALLKHVEAVMSRDHFYLRVTDKQSFQMQNIVGGEHQTAYHFLGFEGEIFAIRIRSLEGHVYSVIEPNEQLLIVEKGEPPTQYVQVRALDFDQPSLWITIRLSAHPFSQYKIEVEKL